MTLDGLLSKLVSNQQSPFNRWKTKQQILQRFSTIAEQSVIESSQSRDLLLSQLESFIYQQSFDSLFGGLLISTSKGYHKPLIINLYLAEILVAADQVFYDGRFSAIAEKIGELCCDFLQGNTSCTQDKLTIEFSDNQLNSLLDQNEISLYKALVEPSSIQSVQQEQAPNYLYSNSCTLREAAEEIAMEYKQAQIIEYSLNQKLLSIKHPFYLSEEPLLTKLEADIAILQSMSKLFPQCQSEQVCGLIKAKFEQLIDDIKETQLDVYQLVELVYCGISILQINFDHQLLNHTIKIWQSIENEIDKLDKESKQQYQIEMIAAFLQKIVEHSQLNLDINIKNMAIKLNSIEQRNIEIILLSKDQIDRDQQLVQLKSKFNPHQYIFVI